MYEGSLEPISNRQDYVETIYLGESGSYPAVTAATAVIKGSCSTITKTLDDGITYDDTTGAMVLTVPLAEIKNLSPGTYKLGLVATISGRQEQIFAGDLAVLDGVVP